MKKSIDDRERDKHELYRPSHLFLLRVWIEKKNDSHGLGDLNGKVQDPVSGQVQYFRGGMALVRILLRAISLEETSGHAETADSSQS